jgi:hypothetical protein
MRRIEYSLFVGAMLLFGCVASVSADVPEVLEITGSVVHGDTLTINGHGFGQRARPTPLRWETWENAMNGQSVGVESEGWYDEVSNATISTLNQRHSRVSKNVLCAFPQSGSGGSYFQKHMPANRYYVNFWIRWDYSGDADGDDVWQVKFFRYDGLYNNDNWLPCYPAFHHLWGATNNYYTEWTVRTFTDACGVVNKGNLTFSMPDTSQGGFWMNVAAQLDQSDVSNVRLSVWQTSPNVGQAIAHNARDYDMTHSCDGAPQRASIVKFGGNVANGGAAVNLHYSEVYVDTTFARVEIGDRSTYNACTRREIQIPVEWNDGSVDVVFNQGSFDAGDQVYLFVANESGIMSASSALAVGGEYDLGPPAAPDSVLMRKTPRP